MKLNEYPCNDCKYLMEVHNAEGNIKRYCTKGNALKNVCDIFLTRKGGRNEKSRH